MNTEDKLIALDVAEMLNNKGELTNEGWDFIKQEYEL